ncbi:hypothetical protein Poli38472_013485 [Pythium oligandrum]|uniref:Myb/SANT-like domain-containing protein n=1 Tax=Pythium oligandrum TaxID=41045 RepID=A0A8K1C7E4_PYTOL|nr:hypothetical protein Poli38472_013485 [Pythium oligandrum]|eukprot:TMW58011.1 hypothetical protein Poli38472_013485 [Pythium oligandrum]
MVLFNEAETMLLLDLYLHYRSNPQNLTSGGVLLKMHARDELTRAMNKCFRRDAPWTESQVTVKFKNLRSEFIELKWLEEQPGFHADGQGMSDEWWMDIKVKRPKVHAFKGKLPWPYYKKMAVIVGDVPPSAHVTESRNVQRISQLLSEIASESGQHVAAPPVSSINGDLASVNGASGQAFDTRSPAMYAQQPMLPMMQLPSKRQRDGSTFKRPRKRVSELTEYERDRQQSLVKSVEHGSKAAADMAKGFNDLVTVFHQQVNKCAQAESDGDGSNDERQILASLATSLEKSSQATAEMAKGYRDLVSFFVQEAEDVYATTV